MIDIFVRYIVHSFGVRCLQCDLVLCGSCYIVQPHKVKSQVYDLMAAVADAKVQHQNANSDVHFSAVLCDCCKTRLYVPIEFD